jgi:hypothetical protein
VSADGGVEAIGGHPHPGDIERHPPHFVEMEIARKVVHRTGKSGGER